MYVDRKKKRVRKMNNNYVFDRVDDLVEYLFSTFGDLSPLKLQKGLYFLYAYYGATYGEARREEGESEQDVNYPNRLFNAKFEAWTYGPVIKSVYTNNKNNQYGDMEFYPNELNDYPDIEVFINELFGQINEISDFTLVDRSHEDVSWSQAYNAGRSTIIDDESLIQEYREKYV